MPGRKRPRNPVGQKKSRILQTLNENENQQLDREEQRESLEFHKLKRKLMGQLFVRLVLNPKFFEQLDQEDCGVEAEQNGMDSEE